MLSADKRIKMYLKKIGLFIFNYLCVRGRVCVCVCVCVCVFALRDQKSNALELDSSSWSEPCVLGVRSGLPRRPISAAEPRLQSQVKIV